MVCGQSGPKPDALRGVAKGNTMNKLVKGSIAGAAGIALLLGGAGTLAYWNSSADLAGTNITSGTLTIAANGSAVAEHAVTGNAVSLIVPGDVVEITQDVTISATGDNLKAALTVDSTGLLTPSNALADNVDFTVTAYDGTTVVSGLSNLTAAQAGSIDSVVITATFDSATAGVVGQNMTLNLANLKVNLTQIP
jgi:alternate signal-mediated exported protein